MGAVGLLLLIAVVASALFSGLETGVVSLSRVRLRVRARRGDAVAASLLRLIERPERVLTTFLIGNTLCNVGSGALASYAAIRLLGMSETAGSVAATAVMTVILLVFSELAPKTYFRRHAEDGVPRFLWFIRAVTWILAPVQWVATSLLHTITGRSGRSAFVTREELRQLVRETRGRLGSGEQHMLESIFEFGGTIVREVMIPLPDVVSLPETAAPSELLDIVRRHRYTRIPIYRQRVDTVVGLVNVFDILYDQEPKATVAEYVRQMVVIPETSRIPRVLVELQKRRETMALVVNEFGSCIGIVSVEDIVEEIMGELADEHRELSLPLQKVGDGYVMDATLDIDELNQELGTALAKDRFDTVGGLVLRRLGRIPAVGERVRVGALEFEVLAVHPYGLRRLRLRFLDRETRTR